MGQEGSLSLLSPWVLVAALFVAGCVNPPPRSLKDVPGGDLPLLLRKADHITEMLDVALVGGRIVAVGEEGTVLFSDDSGTSWRKASCGTTSTLTGICFAETTAHGWAVTNRGEVFATFDRGETWMGQRPADDSSLGLVDVCSLDENHIIALGHGGECVESSDGGETWTRRVLPVAGSRLNRITRGPGGTLHVVGEHGIILVSADRGVTWRRRTFPGTTSLYGLVVASPRVLIAFGGDMRGNIFRSDDGGETWRAVNVARHVLVACGLELRDGRVLLAGHFGRDGQLGFLLSRDRGRSFQEWPNPRGVGASEMIEAPNGDLIALGPDGVTVLHPPPLEAKPG